MKSIKQLQSFKINTEEFKFTEEFSNAINIWGLMIPTHTYKNEDDSKFIVNVSPNVIGAVIQYRDGRFECKLNNIDFQSEYTKDELKQIIIDDIISSIVGEYGSIKLVKRDERILNKENTELLKAISENLGNLTKFLKEGVDYIKEHDNDFTDLNKDEK